MFSLQDDAKMELLLIKFILCLLLLRCNTTPGHSSVDHAQRIENIAGKESSCDRKRLDDIEVSVSKIDQKLEQAFITLTVMKDLLEEKTRNENSQISSLQKRVEDLESGMKHLESDLYNVMKGTLHSHDHGPIVAFEALAENMIHREGPVNFHLLPTELGDAFDIETDNLTVPWTGLYMLSASLNIYINSSARVEIRINGIRDKHNFMGIDLFVPEGKQDFRTGCFTSIRPLISGDVVDMVLISSSDFVYIASFRFVGYRVK